MTSPAVPRRPLGAAEVLDGAVRVVRRNPRAAFGFALPVAVAQALIGAVLVLGTYTDAGLSSPVQLARVALGVIAATVLSGLLGPVVVGDALGGPIPPGEAWRRARGVRGLALLLVLGVVAGLAETVGLIAAVVGGVWLWGVWAVVGPAMTVEGLGPFRALGRSFSLARRCFWRAWGVRALGWLVGEILGLLLTLPFTALALYIGKIGYGQTSGDIHHPGLYVTLNALGQLITVALIAPVLAAVDGLIYLDLRMRIEGLDLVMALPAAPTPSGSAAPVSAW